MKRSGPSLLAVLLAAACMTSYFAFPLYGKAQSDLIKLPEPRHDGPVSVEKALTERRSVRTYQDEALTLAEVSQLLWAAQGITEPKRGLRTAPSPRALYLLETYVLPGNVFGLPMGMYRYQPKGHALVKVSEGDRKSDLFRAAGQAPIKNAPAVILFSGVSDRSTQPYWMYLEAGHAAQNVYLQAVSLKLGTVVMAGFKPEEVKKALNLEEKEQPIYIMPVGRK